MVRKYCASQDGAVACQGHHVAVHALSLAPARLVSPQCNLSHPVLLLQQAGKQSHYMYRQANSLVPQTGPWCTNQCSALVLAFY